MTPRKPSRSKRSASPPTAEPASVAKADDIPVLSTIGSSGLKRQGGILGEEWLPNLRGRKAVQMYREISDNEATVGGALLAMDTLVRHVDWTVEPAKDRTDTDAHDTAQYVDDCRNDMEIRWSELISEIMTAPIYGWAWFEQIFKIRRGDSIHPQLRSKYDDGKIGWRSIDLRSQDSLHEWDFDEATGTLRAMVQSAPPHYRMARIPLAKSLLFRTRSHKGNPEGRSLLRSIYTSYYYVKRIREVEGIGVEKDLAGIPDMQIPLECFTAGATSTQTALREFYERLLPKMRNGEYSSIVRPSEVDSKNNPTGYKFSLVSSGGRRPVDVDAIVKRYESRMLMALLAEFLMLGMDKVGSFALSSDKTDLFASALGAILDGICEVFNEVAFPLLLRLNAIPQDLCPVLKHGDIEKRSLGELSAYVTALGPLLRGGPKLERFLLEEGGLPVEEEGTEPTTPAIDPQQMNEGYVPTAPVITGAENLDPVQE